MYIKKAMEMLILVTFNISLFISDAIDNDGVAAMDYFEPHKEHFSTDSITSMTESSFGYICFAKEEGHSLVPEI